MRLRTPRDIGAVIRERRRSLGLDQGELAEKVGVSRLWINQVERGKPGASLNLVLRTFAAVGIELTADAGEHLRGDADTVVTPDINAIVQAARTKKLP
ncbi:MAG: helix-turn-helix transcriptional regulator [Proteobacteria bacterium]|nr:helix-turn-helix transcriptional regulator [Pseudomonadota bacterium]MBI3500129.1 helix-turn-helix transcriptional regulator [Pseudomonadota bacterium]